MSIVYAVGVGPGDPELLTRKAERVLAEADVILAPVSNPSEASVALDTVRQFIDDSRQEVIVHQFPMTADISRLLPAWQEAARLMAERALSGKRVAFITIGDPLFYSTFIYLLRILQSDYPQIKIEVVPGISSINASSAEGLFPLVEADERLAVIPATAGLEKIIEALTRHETVVLLKVKPLYAEIIELIRQTGRQKSVLFVERVGSERQLVLADFEQISSHRPDYLSLMIIKQPPH